LKKPEFNDFLQNEKCVFSKVENGMNSRLYEELGELS